MYQSLDVSINYPFKAALHHHWYTWMASGGAGKTWTFRKCYISNTLDGLEDDKIFDELACGDKSDMEINVYKDDMKYRDNENNKKICEDNIIEENGNMI
ncbi:4187_t:CDS:2, partial [Acaulospora morrowiae]